MNDSMVEKIYALEKEKDEMWLKVEIMTRTKFFCHETPPLIRTYFSNEANEVKPSQAKSSQVEPSQAKPSQARPVRPGQARSGQVRPGQIRSGEVRSGPHRVPPREDPRGEAQT